MVTFNRQVGKSCERSLDLDLSSEPLRIGFKLGCFRGRQCPTFDMCESGSAAR